MTVACIQAVWFYPQLPPTVASHFNAAGLPDGYMAKADFTGLQLLLEAGMALIFAGIGRLIKMLPATLINMPNKNYWLADERKNDTLHYISDWFRWFGVATVTLLVVVFYLASKANLSNPPRLASVSYPLVSYLLFTAAWALFPVIKFLKVK